MSKGKGGGGTAHAPQVPVYQGIGQNQSIFNNLGTYGSEVMSGLGSLGNWAANIATGGNAQANGTMPANGILANSGSTVYAPFTSGSTGTGGGGWGLSGLNAPQMGPFLTQAVQDLLQAQHSTQPLQALLKTLPGQAQSEFGQANEFFGTGQSLIGQGQDITRAGTSVFDQGDTLLNMATRGTGLFPSQQAYINQAVSTQQNEIAQQLANAGLSNSTQKAQLLGQVALSGAAAGGQLIQANIQAANQTMQTGISEQQTGIQQQGVGVTEQGLGTTEQQIAQDTQKIDLAAQEALFTQFSTISQLSSGLQAQMWTQAMQGYGMLGQFMQNTMGAFGQSLKASEDAQNVMLADAGFQLQADQINAGAQQAAASGFSSMLGSLGGLLGGSGGSGGGLLGGLGGLLGGAGAGIGGAGAGAFGTVGGLGTAAASAGAAGSLGTLGAAGGGAIGAIGSALGALFCEVARTIYGVDSPDWLLFRDWILFRAPKPFRTLYVIHAYRVSQWIKGRKMVCRLIRYVMNAVLWYDDKITGKRV